MVLDLSDFNKIYDIVYMSLISEILVWKDDELQLNLHDQNKPFLWTCGEEEAGMVCMVRQYQDDESSS